MSGGLLFALRELPTNWPCQPGTGVVIAKVDGGMVPIVDPNPEQEEDRRKGKRPHWKEAKIYLACLPGNLTRSYGGIFQCGRDGNPPIFSSGQK